MTIPRSVTFVRLTLAGTATGDMDGRGHLNTQTGGERFQGEASRVAGPRSTGMAANATGSRGGNPGRQHTMNPAASGSD